MYPRKVATYLKSNVLCCQIMIESGDKSELYIGREPPWSRRGYERRHNGGDQDDMQWIVSLVGSGGVGAGAAGLAVAVVEERGSGGIFDGSGRGRKKREAWVCGVCGSEQLA
jgi:hypothetical protein